MPLTILIGEVISKRYRVQRLLGKGAFGKVYLAIDEKSESIDKFVVFVVFNLKVFIVLFFFKK